MPSDSVRRSVPPALLDVLDQRRHRGAQVDEQVRRAQVRGHDREQLIVVAEVALGHQAHLIEVAGKDLGILLDRAVLHDRVRRIFDLALVLETAREKKTCRLNDHRRISV